VEVYIYKTKEEMGKAAAEKAASLISDSIEKRGEANILLATGTSQFTTLDHLVSQPNIDWTKVNIFPLCGLVGLPSNHPASCKHYIKERFIQKIGVVKNAYFINADAPDPEAECKRVGKILVQHPADVALLGIGENGHIAINDPPADFETDTPCTIVNLEIHSRKQQLKEGWFQSLEEVPKQAYSISIKHIMKSHHIVVSVPEERKAIAVKNAIEGIVTNMCPASILQEHPDCHIYLDADAASLLTKKYHIYY